MGDISPSPRASRDCIPPQQGGAMALGHRPRDGWRQPLRTPPSKLVLANTVGPGPMAPPLWGGRIQSREARVGLSPWGSSGDLLVNLLIV